MEQKAKVEALNTRLVVRMAQIYFPTLRWQGFARKATDMDTH